jgi:F-type H+-transporting ATPase subunit b
LEALGLNLGYLIVQIFSFLFLVLILHAWAYKPLVEMFERRRKMIAQGLEDARIASDARQNAVKDVEKLLASAQQEAAERVRTSKQRADNLALQIREQVEQEAVDIRLAAQESARQIREDALKDLRAEVVSLALAAARQVVETTMDETQQRLVIDSFFSGLDDGRLELLEGKRIRPGKIQVTSALPLTDEEKRMIQGDLARRLEEEVEITYKVAPEILGGLMIRVGDRVVDGSVAGQLRDLGASLQRG